MCPPRPRRLDEFAATAVAGGVTESFTFSHDALVFDARDGFTTVTLAGTPHTFPLGTPDLPSLPFTAVIPADAEATGVEILELVETTVPGSYSILPVQHPEAWSVNRVEQPFVDPDPAVYGQDASWPASPATFGRTHNKGGFRVVSFALHPVRYNPSTKQLTLATKIRVRVNYERGARPTPRRSAIQNETHATGLRRLVLNPRDIDKFAPAIRSRSRGSFLLPAGDFEHVIITPAVWADSFAGLVEWRTRQGWRSRVMTLEEIIADYPGRDVPEQMRNFLKDADTTWGLVFAFIARDDYPSGANQVRQARAYNYNVKSDMYFSDLDGDWDANGNSVFGEVADNVDGYADIHVGMITITDGAELSNYLGKIFRYEFESDQTPGWVTKMLLPNGVTFSNEFNDSIAAATPSPPWFDLKMYTTGGMITPTPQRFCDSLNSGYGLASIIAHGSPNVIDLGGSVTSTMMTGLTNTNRMNFSTYVCCNTGEWDLGSTNGDCIAENMVFHAPNGFIGVAKNDKSGWVRVAEFFNYSMMWGAIGYRSARQVTSGQVVSWGKDYWVWCLEDSGKWRMEAFERNLFGEPAVPIWTDDIFVANVARPGAVNIGSGIPVAITVTTPTDAPVESALVCLTKGTETFARGWTDAFGQVTLNVSPLTPGHLQLTVTSANNQPHLDSIPVMAAGRFVAYLRSTIADSVGGNGDGIINPGETVRIRTWVKNYGSQTANNVTAQLITHAAGITITDPDASFGNIAGEDSAYDADAWELQVANGLPNGHAVACSVVSRDANDSVWVSYATWYVGAPALAFQRLAVQNPQGVLNPGETAELEITLRNTGLGHGYNVHGVVSSNDPRLTFPDSASVWGTVMAGDSAVNSGDRFTVSANASIPRETVIACTLRLYGDNGYESTEEFTIEVGEVRAVDPTPDNATPILYWAFDDGDTGYVQAPEFDWFDITGVGTRLGITSDDQTVQLNLPPAFGPFYFYGRRFTQLSVCGNGWIAPGLTTRTLYSNAQIPSTSQPSMMALMWDDLYPPTSGGVWSYHDEANNRFIVQFDSMPYFSEQNTYDWHQLIIYDTTQAAPDGNSVFDFQYLTANHYGSATVGINDSTSAIGIQTLFDGTYHRGSLPITPGHAIRFTTEEPLTGVAESPGPAGLERLGLAVAPSPFNRTTTVHYNLARDAEVLLRVYDASGRQVRTLENGRLRAGSRHATWDGRDDAGRRVAHGVYFVRLDTPGRQVKVKTVLTR
ncbi:MAG TPA: hypothetical protein ENN51_08275 [candidate division WOR-3 bacterium]|uniref:T9SS type A sorting domain-containing protein n=1 Tax=candidate division WOR-3 bacterium TaxID=2052148 RepID=A0A7V0T6V2_UNCW3|nr:hypothetical protein [candidate division WOR-3 bacterium]